MEISKGATAAFAACSAGGTHLAVVDGVGAQDIEEGALPRALALLVVHVGGVCPRQVTHDFQLLVTAACQHEPLVHPCVQVSCQNRAARLSCQGCVCLRHLHKQDSLLLLVAATRQNLLFVQPYMWPSYARGFVCGLNALLQVIFRDLLQPTHRIARCPPQWWDACTWQLGHTKASAFAESLHYRLLDMPVEAERGPSFCRSRSRPPESSCHATPLKRSGMPFLTRLFTLTACLLA